MYLFYDRINNVTLFLLMTLLNELYLYMKGISIEQNRK